MNDKEFKEWYRKLPKKVRKELQRRSSERYEEAYNAGKQWTFQQFLDSDELRKAIKNAMAEGYWEAVKRYNETGRFF